MKRPTKIALENIALKMVDDGLYIKTRGSVYFMTEAVKIHKSMDSMVSIQTIKTHEQELEQMCQLEMLKRYPLNKNIAVPNQFDDDADDDFYEDEDDDMDDAHLVLYDEFGFEVDDYSLISIVIAKIEKMMKTMMSHKQVKVYLPKVEYNMFYVGEDGLTWLKGSFKNQPVGTPGMRYINKAGISVTEKTHAKYMLSQTTNTYTQYDVDVLTKISTGTYE